MPRLTRRELFRKAAAAAGAVGAAFWFAPRAATAAVAQSLLPPPVAESFSWAAAPEIDFLKAAVGRLIPADALGPGALEAGVAFFIDQQLAGPFGRGEAWYMQGPWKEGTDEQGYQLKLTPAQLYRAAIAAVDEHCRKTRAGKSFAQLTASAQDEVLHGLEQGEIALNGLPAKEFFHMLLQNTNEGYFADPIYGGNRDFAGWKLLGFPGPRYNYVIEIRQHGKPYTEPTVGLAGRSGARPRQGG